MRQHLAGRIQTDDPLVGGKVIQDTHRWPIGTIKSPGVFCTVVCPVETKIIGNMGNQYIIIITIL